jgi:hypothetical protein
MSSTEEERATTATPRIVLAGVVDRATVGSVTDEVRTVLAQAPRVEVDVTGVDRWEPDALSELAACARLGAGIEIRMEGHKRSSRRLD